MVRLALPVLHSGPNKTCTLLVYHNFKAASTADWSSHPYVWRKLKHALHTFNEIHYINVFLLEIHIIRYKFSAF